MNRKERQPTLRALICSLARLPWDIVRGVPGLLRLYFTRLPITRHEVITAVEPVFGRSGARLYFAGLRLGYVREGYWLSGRHVCYSMGLRDGSALRRNPRCWPELVQSHVPNSNKVA
jgi:hypothetical protein